MPPGHEDMDNLILHIVKILGADQGQHPLADNFLRTYDLFFLIRIGVYGIVYKRGPPVSGSVLSLPITITLLPLCKYSLQASACFLQTETRTQIVSFTYSLSEP